jgi:lipopolysaccharide export system protein LptA
VNRRWELVVLVFGGLFLLLLAISFRPGRRPAKSASREAMPRVAPAQEAGQPTTVLKGFDYTEAVRGKPLFRIQSERTVGFGPAAGLLPNVYVLEKVTLTLYPERGAAVAVQSDRAEYDQRTKQARLSGNVRWTDDRGALGETDRMEFNPSSRVLAAPEKIHLSQGSFSLDARSGQYDAGKREVHLDGPIQGSGTGQETGGLTSLKADSAVYRREQSIVELDGSVSGRSQTGDTIACERFVFKLDQDGRRLEWSRAEGSVRGVLVSTPAGAHAGKGTSRVERRYAGDTATFAFGPDGSLRALSLSGRPAGIVESVRSLHAAAIDLSLEGGRAVSADAKGQVHIDADKSRADCAEARVSFAPGGEIETLELARQVRMEGDGRSARADKAVNLPARGVWVLTGESEGSAWAVSGGSRISAARIEIDEMRHNLRADGSARAVFLPGDSHRSTVPAILGDPSRPTYGKAARITLDETSHVATLSGGATLWQDASSLSGDDITLNDQERSVVAVGNTRTVLVGRPQAAKAPEREPCVVVARRAWYREADSVAHFEGAVRVARGSWRATGNAATAVLGKDRDLERVEITGDVALADQAEGRSGQAQRAIDYTSEGRTVLEGSPAWVLDGQGNRVSGALLTITERGRRVEVTAPEGGKTETIHRTRSQ